MLKGLHNLLKKIPLSIKIILILILAASCFIPPVFSQPNESAEKPYLDSMLASMLMFGFRGSVLQPTDSFYEFLKNGRPCNIILFDKDVSSGSDRNIISSEQVRELTGALTQAAGASIFIAVDQEGGQVRRLKPGRGFYDLPSAQSMGQGNEEKTRELAQEQGKELKNLGINVDLAPVCDVDSNPFNPVIGKLGRAFNTDPALVATHALAFGQGLASAGVIPVLKHFPGQGCADKDTHEGSADVSQCWNAETDLRPFAEIIHIGWPGMIMMGHIFNKHLDQAAPASLSYATVTGLLRNALKWQGVIISDDLQMKAISEHRDIKEIIKTSVDAGNDILLFGNNLQWNPNLHNQVWEALKELVETGQISEERIRQSWQRIAALRAAYGF